MSIPWLCITFVAVIECLASSMFAQGTVIFANHVLSPPPDRLVRDVNGQSLVGTNFLAQLYYGSVGASTGSLTPVAAPPATFRGSTTSIPGTWLGGPRTLEGFTAGNVVSLQVRVWDVAVGSTWEDALAVGFDGTQYGASSVFSYIVPTGQPGSDLTMQNFQGFTLVPEPSVGIFGVIGLVVIGFWKRCGQRDG